MSTHRRPLARRALLAGAPIALAAGLLVGLVGPASAHDELLLTQPAADAVLDAAPQTLDLQFSSDVLEISPTVVLLGPAGDVDLPTPTVDGAQVSVVVPAGLVPGDYSVVWRVVSADGHPVQGTFAFSLTAPAVTPTPTPTPDAATTSPSAPSPEATGTPTAVPSTSAPAQTGSGSGALPRTLAVIAGALALAIAGGVILRRRR